jgi:hypothetical protein
VASSSGPVLGGLLTGLSWRWIFFINLPVGAAALVLLARIPRLPHRRVPFDWAGQVTAVLAVGGLTHGSIEAGAAGFGATWVIAAFAVAALALAAFLAAQARGRHPMMPLDLFRSRTVTVAVGFAFEDDQVGTSGGGGHPSSSSRIRCSRRARVASARVPVSATTWRRWVL